MKPFMYLPNDSGLVHKWRNLEHSIFEATLKEEIHPDAEQVVKILIMSDQNIKAKYINWSLNYS